MIRKKRSKPRRHRPELFFRRSVSIRVMSDGREVCNLATAEGKRVYRTRVKTMLYRQHGLCCNCRKPLLLEEATFEHENGRCSGRRDDRIEANGQRINGASHMLCNHERGSKRTPIYKG